MQKSDKKSKSALDFEVAILSSLGSSDALKIFLAAEGGIESSTLALKELGLTQKRYYTCLKKLVDTGLVEKSRGSYKHTFLGRVVNESFLRPLDVFKSGGNDYALLSKLQSSNLDPETKKEFENTFVDSEAFSLLGRGNLTDSMRIIHSYEQLIEQVFEMVEKTEHSLYFVSKYTDGRVAEAIVKATERGVQSSCISERKTLSESLQAVRMLFNPKLLKSVLKMVSNANNMLRYIDFIPFSFAVSDEERIIVELPNPLTHNFCIAFVFQDRIFGKKLVGIFKDLWDKGRFPLEDEDAENKADAHR